MEVEVNKKRVANAQTCGPKALHRIEVCICLAILAFVISGCFYVQMSF